MSIPRPTTTPRSLVTPEDQDEWDAPLCALAQKSGGDLRKLLFAFFSFLNRRTDFYIITPEDATINIGFKQGDAEKLLLAAFRQFPLRKIPSQQKDQQQFQSK